MLDTLLTSKNLRCMQHKIDMTCVIDGKLFDSMDVMDILFDFRREAFLLFGLKTIMRGNPF